MARDSRSGNWVGISSPLRVCAVGRTWEEFVVCASQALAGFLRTRFEAGDLELTLARHNWSAELPPPGTKVRFDVPFEVRRTPLEALLPV